MNPFTLHISGDTRATLYDAAIQHASFAELVTMIETRLINGDTDFLNAVLDPEPMELATEIAIDILDSLPDTGSKSKIGDNAPWLEDEPGLGINVKNPTFVFYGAEITGSETNEVALIPGRAQLVDFEWGWPPVTTSDDVESSLSLSDGVYDVRFTKGFEGFSVNELLNPNNASGAASIANTTKGLGLMLDLLLSIDSKWLANHKKVERVINNFSKIKDATDVARADLSYLLGDLHGIQNALDRALVGDDCIDYSPGWETAHNKLCNLDEFVDDITSDLDQLAAALLVTPAPPSIPTLPNPDEDLAEYVKRADGLFSSQYQRARALAIVMMLHHLGDGDHLAMLRDV